MRHYTLYCECFEGMRGGLGQQIPVSKGVQHEGDYEYEMRAVKDMTERAESLMKSGNYGSVWMHIWCIESSGRRRDVKKWTLTQKPKSRVVDFHDAIHYDTEKPDGEES